MVRCMFGCTGNDQIPNSASVVVAGSSLEASARLWHLSSMCVAHLEGRSNQRSAENFVQ